MIARHMQQKTRQIPKCLSNPPRQASAFGYRLASLDRHSEDIRVQDDSHASSTFTISDISQSLEVTPAAIAGVIFKV